MRRSVRTWLALVALPLLGGGVAHAHDKKPAPAAVIGELGSTVFPNSGTPAAQADFLRGLLLLHSFEFDAARAAFAAAQVADPGFAMAYWGEALSHNQPIWGEQDLEAARAVLARLAPTSAERLAKAPTDRERRYLAAAELLFGDGTKVERDARYSSALGELADAYPEDLDARALYALSLLGLTGVIRDHANYMRAASEAEKVFEIDPRHPGALHYLIHAYDDPVHAALGLRAARRYGKVAPAAAHAQHMPSHIFFALGLWDDAVEANVASLATARAAGRGGYHALTWLAYAQLQQGLRNEPLALVRSVEEDVASKSSQAARDTLAYLRAMWIVETGGGTGDTAWSDVDTSGISSIYSFSAHEFARGVAWARSGDFERAQQRVAALRERTEQARASVKGVVASRFDTVTPEEIAQAEVLAQALDGVIEFARGRQQVGLARLEAAIARTDGMAFEYGPPWSAKPLDELHGELLLEAGRPADAAVAFAKTLATLPNRRLSNQGLQTARRAMSGG